jgi:hypothetical protein
MKNYLRIAFGTLLLFSLHQTVPALAVETIVSYGLFFEPGDQTSTAASATASNTTSSAMIRGGGLNPNAGDDSFNSNGWATNAEFTPTAVNTGGYVGIGFDTDAGFSVLLDELIIGTRSSGSGPSTIGVFTSIDGFTSPVDVIDQTAGWPTSSSSGFVNSTIDISSLGNVSGSFRIRFMNVGSANTADVTRLGDMDLESTWRIVDHLTPGVGFSDSRITGTVVPEPTTLTLATLTLLGMSNRRRKRA